MHPYFGDITLGTTHDFKFNTAVSGVPTTLAGSPVISAYVGNGTTEITAGITLTVDIDGRVGLHNIRVVATSGNGFATATDVDLVVTVGTVGGSSVVPMLAASFSIENRSLSGSAPTVEEIRTEMDTNSTKLLAINDNATEANLRLEGLVIEAGMVLGATGNDASHLHLPNLEHADDDVNSLLLVIKDVSTGLKYSRWIIDFSDTGDLATVAPLPFTPEASVDEVWVTSIRADVTGGSGLDAAGVRAAVGLASANLDTQLTTIDDFLDTEVAAIKAKTDNLPSDPADHSLVIVATDAIFARLGAPAGASVSADVAAVKADTAAIGAAGAGLTGVPWNAAWDAEVESEVNDATSAQLTAIVSRLSPLVTKTGAVVSDGGNSATSFKTDFTESVNNFYKPPQLAKITSGALVQQNARISGYNGTTKVLTFSDGFTSTPADGVTFEVIND